MSPLPSVLIIGCGSIGERHLRCFQRTGRCRVTACDTSAPLLERIAQSYGVPVTPDPASAVASGDFDAIVICTPAPFHIPQAIQALDAGRHVLIEKPLSHSLAGLDTLFAARNRAKRHVAVAYVYHVYPFLNAARAISCNAPSSVRSSTPPPPAVSRFTCCGRRMRKSTTAIGPPAVAVFRMRSRTSPIGWRASSVPPTACSPTALTSDWWG
jgi:hypothetical protein